MSSAHGMAAVVAILIAFLAGAGWSVFGIWRGIRYGVVPCFGPGPASASRATQPGWFWLNIVAHVFAVPLEGGIAAVIIAMLVAGVRS